jgi:hypothetical protein
MGRSLMGMHPCLRPFLPEHAFAPETITAISIAVERVCATMRLPDKDRLREVVAKRIMYLASGSYGDPDALYDAAIASFKRGE